MGAGTLIVCGTGGTFEGDEAVGADAVDDVLSPGAADAPIWDGVSSAPETPRAPALLTGSIWSGRSAGPAFGVTAPAGSVTAGVPLTARKSSSRV